jgi:hypothetical protein
MMTLETQGFLLPEIRLSGGAILLSALFYLFVPYAQSSVTKNYPVP